MQTYRSHKLVMARPMTRGDYTVYRGWTIPPDENPADIGYLVEYPDSPNSNHPDHKGYISWSPKDVFDRGNTLVLAPHVERMITEVDQLHERTRGLDIFINANPLFESLPKEEREDMHDQLRYMEEYLEVLTRRIDRATEGIK